MDAFDGEFYQVFLEDIIPRYCGCNKYPYFQARQIFLT